MSERVKVAIYGYITVDDDLLETDETTENGVPTKVDGEINLQFTDPDILDGHNLRRFQIHSVGRW